MWRFRCGRRYWLHCFLFLQYEEDGYLVVKDIFTGDEKKELIEAMDELIDM